MIYNASSASAFVNNLGVNVHVSWPGAYPYSDTAKVMSAMTYLGVHSLRDYMNADTVGIYNTLASNGFHFDLMYNPADNLAGYVTQVHNLEAAHPGSVLSLEGPNEVNGQISSAISMQADIYTRANADPLLADKPVIAPSLSGADPNTFSQLQVGAYADYGNLHDYWGNGQPAYGWSPSDSTYWWSTWVKDAQLSVPGKPVAVTETGISTASASGGVDQATQAKVILNAVMDAGKNGAPATYLYELVESHNAGAADLESHFGLYNYDWTAKPAAVALHNFTTVLTDGGALAGPAGSLDYVIQGVPQWGGQMLFQEADGTKDIVVWAEPDIWNESSRTAVAAPNTPITIDLAAAANVAIYDPMQGSAPIQVLTGASHIAFNVTDHPLIVEFKSTTASPAPAPSDLAAASDTGVVTLLGPTTGGAGQVLTAAGPSSVLTGGAGADTLNAGQGYDTLTGGGGADHFVLAQEPWAPIHITDFQVGSDVLDLSALFKAVGYAGADPVADHLVYLTSDDAGGTLVRYDHDGNGPNPFWPNTIVELEHVSSTGLSWAQLQGGASADGPQSGQVLTSPAPYSVLTGGAGADTITASQAYDTLAGGAGADHFVLAQEPWAPIYITDFEPGADKLDLRALFKIAGYTGSDPVADHYVHVEDDGNGGVLIRFDRDGSAPNPVWPNTIIDLEHLSPAQVTSSDWIVH